MSRKLRAPKDVTRDITNLENRKLRGEISSKEFSREYKRLRIETDEVLRDGYSNDALVYGLDYGIGVSTGTTANPMESMRESIREYFKSKAPLDAMMTGVFDDGPGGIFSTGDDRSVAETAWSEHGGVVMCECESLHCERVIEIDKDEYIKASTPGYRRLTHPDCGYGIVNSLLMERHEKWHIWDKGW